MQDWNSRAGKVVQPCRSIFNTIVQFQMIVWNICWFHDCTIKPHTDADNYNGCRYWSFSTRVTRWDTLSLEHTTKVKEFFQKLLAFLCVLPAVGWLLKLGQNEWRWPEVRNFFLLLIARTNPCFQTDESRLATRKLPCYHGSFHDRRDQRWIQKKRIFVGGWTNYDVLILSGLARPALPVCWLEIAAVPEIR